MENIINEQENLVKLLKPADIAKTLNICLSKAYQLMQTGEIPTVRIDHSVRVRPCDLDEYIERCWSGWKNS